MQCTLASIWLLLGKFMCLDFDTFTEYHAYFTDNANKKRKK